MSSHHVTVGGGFLRRWRVMRQVTNLGRRRDGRLSYDVRYVEVARFVTPKAARRRADMLNAQED